MMRWAVRTQKPSALAEKEIRMDDCQATFFADAASQSAILAELSANYKKDER